MPDCAAAWATTPRPAKGCAVPGVKLAAVAAVAAGAAASGAWTTGAFFPGASAAGLLRVAAASGSVISVRHRQAMTVVDFMGNEFISAQFVSGWIPAFAGMTKGRRE